MKTISLEALFFMNDEENNGYLLKGNVTTEEYKNIPVRFACFKAERFAQNAKLELQGVIRHSLIVEITKDDGSKEEYKLVRK